LWFEENQKIFFHWENPVEKEEKKEKGKKRYTDENIQRSTKKTMYILCLRGLTEEMINIIPIGRKWLNRSFHILQKIIILTNDLLNMIWNNLESFKFFVKIGFLFFFVPQHNQLILMKIF
jgi:hypothetical protein